MKYILLIFLLLPSVCFAESPLPHRDANSGDIVLCLGNGLYVFSDNDYVGEINGNLVPMYSIGGEMFMCWDESEECGLSSEIGVYSMVIGQKNNDGPECLTAGRYDKNGIKGVLVPAFNDKDNFTLYLSEPEESVSESNDDLGCVSSTYGGSWVSGSYGYTEESTLHAKHAGDILTVTDGDIYITADDMVSTPVYDGNPGDVLRLNDKGEVEWGEVDRSTELVISRTQSGQFLLSIDGQGFLMPKNASGYHLNITDDGSYECEFELFDNYDEGFSEDIKLTENKKESGMFKIIVDFMTLVGVTAAIAAFLVMGIPAVFRLMVSYVKEDDRGSYWEEKSWPGDDYIGNVVLYHAIVPIFVGVVCFSFPATVPLGLIWLGLFSMRGFFRFKTKIKKALDSKSTRGHSHPEEDTE